MNWPAFFLACFIVGFALSALSFALSAFRVHLHLHLPFGHAAHVHASHAAAHGHAADGGVSIFNFSTITAFLAWFGGAGFLLTSQFRWWAGPSLLVATGVGLLGAFAVFVVMVRVLWSPDENMRSADYRMVGVLGRVSSAIRADGIGEVIYSLGGTRHSCGARSSDGTTIEKGTEVVVMAYDRGIASVRRWVDFEEQT